MDLEKTAVTDTDEVVIRCGWLNQQGFLKA